MKALTYRQGFFYDLGKSVEVWGSRCWSELEVSEMNFEDCFNLSIQLLNQ